MKDQYQIIIIGAGAAGLSVAARLLRKDRKLDILLIDPAEYHYYQAAWTLVGAGAEKFETTRRPMKKLIPKGATWLQDAVDAINPTEQVVGTQQHGKLKYDYLVVASGMKFDFSLVEGLEGAIGTQQICSNYIDPNYTWEVLQTFKEGQALFTQSPTATKCGAAPQKIMYLADDYFRKTKVRDKIQLVYAVPGTIIFGVEKFRETLEKVVSRKKIHCRFFHKLTKIDAKEKKAYYQVNIEASAETGRPTVIDHGEQASLEMISEQQLVIPFDMLHLAPPQRPHDFIIEAGLTGQEGPAKGWVNVDINTLQHKEYPNIFSLGDTAGLPTGKTGAAVRKQAPVVAENLYHFIQNLGADVKQYNGYSACPVVTGYGKMVLAEFGYKNVPMPDPLIRTFVDTTKEQYSMWLLKKYGLPFMYWNFMLKGLA